MRTSITAALIFALISGACYAQDRDSDGLPDAIEYQLGSDVGVVEQFELIYHDGVIGEDDQTVAAKHKDGQDVVDIFAASVGADRWLFKVTFAQDYVGEGHVFVFYLDVDCDEATGRQDANVGTDLMYSQNSGGFGVSEKTPGLRAGPARMAAVGNAIYICDDLALGEGMLPGQVKFRILSHVAPPASADSDSSDWVIADLPAVSGDRKPRIGAPVPPAPLAELTADRPDADSDGIPDDVELVLGMDPETADPLHLVHDDLSATEGDQMSAAWKLAPDVTRVYFGNVAQDRWVFRVDFADALNILGNRVMLYFDADNDVNTGRREGAPGTDVRFICSEGSFNAVIRNASVLGRDRDLRGFVDEQSVYFSMDLSLNHNEEGNAECRGYILCQRSAPDQPGDGDATIWFPLVGGGERDLPKSRVGVFSQFLSEGVVAQKPWLGWREQIGAMGASHLDMIAAPISGMKHFNGAVEPFEDGATVTLTSPIDGDQHVNVLIQDSAIGREEVAVSVAGTQVARLVAAQDTGDLYLFTTKSPLTMKKGDVIELVAKEPAQDFRICEVFLTPSVLEPPPIEIRNLSTWVRPGCLPGASTGETVDVDVCFLTLRAVDGVVRWGRGDALDQQAAEEKPTHNHRVRLTGLTRGESYSLQVLCREGSEEATSEVLRFVADEVRPAACSVQRKQVALSVSDLLEGGRPAWPVSGGIPIAQGELASADKCRLLGAGGRVVDAQFDQLAPWPDGSVKWLLVSLVHEGASPDYMLEYGEAVATPAVTGGIAVEQTDAGMVVTTDVLRAELSRERFAPPGTVTIDGQTVVTGDEGFVLVDDEGNRYASADAPPTRFEIEEAGPVRTVVRVEGPITGDAQQGLRYRCRMYFYRGFAGIPTQISLLVQEGKSGFPPTLSRIKSLTWPMVGAADAGASRWVQDDVSEGFLAGWLNHHRRDIPRVACRPVRGIHRPEAAHHELLLASLRQLSAPRRY